MPFLFLGVVGYVSFRLYRDSPARRERLARKETEILYRHAIAGAGVPSEADIDTALRHHWPAGTPEPLRTDLLAIGREIFAAEDLSPDVPPPPAICNSVEGARYRDRLARLGQARHDPDIALSLLHTISESLAVVARAVPPIQSDIVIDVAQFLSPQGKAVETIIAPFFRPSDPPQFKALRERLGANLAATHRSSPIMPRDYKGEDAPGTYLAGTPLLKLFALKTPFAIPEARRFEHTHIVAGSGHGKTQTLQYFIAHDLPDIAAGLKSVVVIDSQGDLINTILAAKHLPPERIVLIDPEDIAYPVCLNLFAVGQERLDGYDALERERLTNSIIELYDFVLGSLLSSGMTAKQSVVFRYITRLMFHIPDATIHTLRDLLEPGGADKYRDYIRKLPDTPRRFFEVEFDTKEFTATKTQVLRRLYGILENQTFERMFSHPASTFDMFSELQFGKLILINTAKSLLKEQGTEVFGRFFIALLAQAAQERATIPADERLPAIVYIDEAQDYFDQNIGVILSQARKYKVGMVLAHQYLGQLTGGLAEALEANTAIKLAGGVSTRDARALSSQMGATPEVIERQPKGSFATSIRGFTRSAISMRIPFFRLEGMPRATKEERDAIRAYSRARYAEAWQEMKPAGEDEPSPSGDGSDPESGPDDPPADPFTPSPTL
ncbi:MAG: type IV secretory system conjugative DNA transfer family protein [Paracoccus sp. (in: a-proteobacteria)]